MQGKLKGTKRKSEICPHPEHTRFLCLDDPLAKVWKVACSTQVVKPPLNLYPRPLSFPPIYKYHCFELPLQPTRSPAHSLWYTLHHLTGALPWPRTWWHSLASWHLHQWRGWRPGPAAMTTPWHWRRASSTSRRSGPACSRPTRGSPGGRTPASSMGRPMGYVWCTQQCASSSS